MFFKEQRDEKREAERLKTIAQSMREFGTPTGTEMVSGRVVKKSPLEGLAKALATAGSGYYEGQARQKEDKISDERMRRMAQMLGGDPNLVSLAGYDPDLAMRTYADNLKQTSEMKNANWMGISPQEKANMERQDAYQGAIKDGSAFGGFDQQGRPIANPVMMGDQTIDQYRTGLENERNMNAEGAKANYDMMELNTPQGMRMMTRQQAVNLSNPVVDDIGVNNMNLQDIERAIGPQGQGSNPAINQPYDQIRPQMQAGIELKTPPSDKTKALNDDFIKNSYRPSLENAEAARENNARLEAIRNIDLTGNTGWGTETRAAAANVLTGLGMAPESAQQLATDAQTFKAIVSKQVNNELMMQKGPQTEGDAQRAFSIQAQLGNTPQANQFIIDMAQAINNRSIRKAEFLTQNQGRFEDLTQLEAGWQQQAGSIFDDPLMSKYSQSPQEPPPQGGLTPEEQQELQRLRQKYGR